MMMMTVVGLCVMLQSAEAKLYRWTGATSTAWGLAGNWWNETDNVIAGEVPGINDNVWFTGSPSNAPSIAGGTGSVIRYAASLDVDISITITLGNNLVVGAFDIAEAKTLTLFASGGLFRLDTGTGTLHSGSRLTGSCQFMLNGKLNMPVENADTYEGLSGPGIGPSIYTYVLDPNFMTSHCVFYGDLNLGEPPATPVSIVVGQYNLYLGQNADILHNTTNLKATSGFVETPHQDCITSTPAGRICKQYQALLTSGYTTYNFPVGDASHEYTPIELRLACFPASCTPTSYAAPFPYVSVRTVTNWGSPKGHPDHGQGTFGVYWVIDENGLPQNPSTCGPYFGFAGIMRFSNTYRASQPDSIFSAMYKAPLPCGSGSWENVCSNTGFWDLQGSIQVLELTGDARSCPFGPYDATFWDVDCMYGTGDISSGTTGGNSNIPVELTSFSARYYEGRVRLKWNTATEVSNHGFFIERSADGERWEDVGFVEGAGQSNVPLDYEYTDLLEGSIMHAPQIAYRLRQEDRDGTTDYSGIRWVHPAPPPGRVELYQAYPNPFNPCTVLGFNLLEAGHVRLRVFNALGQQVGTVADASFEAGFHTLEFNGTELPSGVYIAVLEAAGTVRQQKLVLNK